MDITDRIIEEHEVDLTTKLDAYTRLIDFRYKNMLVKADPMQMLPVEVEVPGNGMVNLEEVATLGITSDDQFTVFANDPILMTQIQRAIFKVHPLIKQELYIPNVDKTNEDLMNMMDAAESVIGHKPEPVKGLLLTMPPMTKERRDFVKNAVDGLQKQTKARFLKTLEDAKMMMAAEVVVYEPDRVDEGADKLEAKHDEMWKGIEDMTEEFLKEVNERYEAYDRATNPPINEDPAANMTTEERIHSGLSFKFGQYEE